MTFFLSVSIYTAFLQRTVKTVKKKQVNPQKQQLEVHPVTHDQSSLLQDLMSLPYGHTVLSDIILRQNYTGPVVTAAHIHTVQIHYKNYQSYTNDISLSRFTIRNLSYVT